MNITVIYNSSDSDEPSEQDTKKSAQEVAEALGATLVAIRKQDAGDRSFFEKLHTDIVFNLIEWSGFDTKYALQSIDIMEDLKIPYTGSRHFGYEVHSDKIQMKKKFDELGIPTPRYQIYDKDFVTNNLNFPVIAKLTLEHCSIGLDESNVVFNTKDLGSKILDLRSRYDMPILVEEFIDGEEVHVSVIDKDGSPWILPPDRIVFEESGKKSILGHDAKWEGGMMNSSWGNFDDYSDALKQNIIKSSRDCYIGLGGRSYSRIDIRVKGEEYFILEINNNPGIDWDDDNALCHSSKKAGFADFKSLLTHITNDALKHRISY